MRLLRPIAVSSEDPRAELPAAAGRPLHYRCVAGSQWLSHTAPAALAKRCAGAIAIHSEQQAFMGRGTESVEERQGVGVRTPSDAYSTPGLLLHVSFRAEASVGAVDLNPNLTALLAKWQIQAPLAASAPHTWLSNSFKYTLTSDRSEKSCAAALVELAALHSHDCSAK